MNQQEEGFMFLGIDIGTSAVKIVLISEDGKMIASSQEALTLQTPKQLWSEQDPEQWWQATLKAMNDLRHQSICEWENVKAIGLSGQMHGAVLLDENNEVIRPAILWNDGRSVQQCERLKSQMPDIAFLAGAVAMPGFTAPKLMWLKEHEVENFNKIRKILLPKDYIRFKLCGNFATDMCDAAGTFWLDEEMRDWSDALCTLSEIDESVLPALYEGHEITGYVHQRATNLLGLSKNVAVVAGGGDAGAGAVGIGAVTKGDCFMSLGTSGQLFVTTDSYKQNAKNALHSYAHCVPKHWFIMAAMLNGASPMQWFASNVNMDVKTILEQAEAVSKEATPLFIPYLTGERTPHNDMDIRAGFYGLSNSTTIAHMMAAIVEAIAYSFCDARDAMQDVLSMPNEIIAIGGGAQSDFVLQTIADALSVTILRCSDTQSGPAYGAARLAAMGYLNLKLEQIAVKPKTEKAFTPNVRMQDYYQSRLMNYRKMYNCLKEISL